MKVFFTSLILLCILVGGNSSLKSQDTYLTKTGGITFFSETPLENIEAINKQVTSLLNTKTGELVFSVLIRSFEFKKALMQEHFNENYMESDKFPKAKFTGKVKDFEAFSWNENGEYSARISGFLEIHGVKKEISVLGNFLNTKEGIKANAEFVVQPKDFDIQIPKIVEENIAKKIQIKVLMNYKPYK